MDEITEAILKAISEIEGIDLDNIEIYVRKGNEYDCDECQDDRKVCVIHVKLLNDEKWFFPFNFSSEESLDPYATRMGAMAEAGVMTIVECYDFDSNKEGGRWLKSQGFKKDEIEVCLIASLEGWKVRDDEE